MAKQCKLPLSFSLSKWRAFCYIFPPYSYLAASIANLSLSKKANTSVPPWFYFNSPSRATQLQELSWGDRFIHMDNSQPSIVTSQRKNLNYLQPKSTAWQNKVEGTESAVNTPPSELSSQNCINDYYRCMQTDKNKFKKAFVLAETIRRVKELKKVVSEKRAAKCEDMECGLPSGADRLSLEHGESGEGTVKAVLSCEDRQELVVELARALKSVKVKVVRVEMVTVGGRSKFVLWVQGLKEGSGMLKRVLEAVVRRPSWITRKPRNKC